VVKKLLQVYRDVTGDQNADAFTIGGGTYAKALGKQFVAFGPEFPGAEPSNVHNVDEHVTIDAFIDHCVICTMAMYELAK
jgi:succinyl-diaminopimelate desuccinylase